MCLNLNDYQFKASRYNYGSTYMSSMVITNQKPTTDTQKPNRKEPKYTIKKCIKPQWERQKEEMDKEELQKQLENKE